MAAVAGDGSMSTEQGEAGAGMFGELTLRSPILFGVAIQAGITEPVVMDIPMATRAASVRKFLHRPAIVMAPQALRLLMLSRQCVSGLGQVVVAEIGTQRIPPAGGMAHGAVPWKGLVGDNRSASSPPIVHAVGALQDATGHTEGSHHEQGDGDEVRKACAEIRHGAQKVFCRYIPIEVLSWSSPKRRPTSTDRFQAAELQ